MITVSTCANTSNYMNDKCNFDKFEIKGLSNTSNYMNDKCNFDTFEIKGLTFAFVILFKLTFSHFCGVLIRSWCRFSTLFEGALQRFVLPTTKFDFNFMY